MAEIEDFDLDRTTDQAWADFTQRLAEVLSVMDDTSDLTISTSGPSGAGPIVRFSFVAPESVQATLVGDVPDRARSLGWEQASDQLVAIATQEDALSLAELVSATIAGPMGVLHPVFLEPDQLAEILRPQAMPEDLLLGTGPFSVVMPSSQAELDAVVDTELAKTFGHPPLRNTQGDVAIRVGSSMVFLRSTPDFQELVLFSALVHEVSGRSTACEVLNDLNMDSRYCRFALHRDRVFVQQSVPANPFVPVHLHQALANISAIADGIDDELASRLSGRTTFSEQEPDND